MAEIDQSKVIPDEIDPSQVTIDPYAPPPQRGMVSRLGSAALQGAKAEAVNAVLKPVNLAASAPFILADKIRGAITGNQNDTRAQDWAFRTFVDPAVQLGEELKPTAEQSASIPESIAYGLGGLAADLPLIAFTAGKAGAPAAAANAGRIAQAVGAAARGAQAMVPVAAGHAVSQTEDAARAGVDLPTAFASGATAGLTTVASGVVPLAMRGGLATRAATGAISGAATGEAGRIAQNAVLSEYENLQNPFTAQGLATQAATGALLGGIMGPRPVRAPRADAAAPVGEAPVEPAGLLPAPDTTPRGAETLISFPDGSVGTRADAEAFIRSYPENQQAEVRASLLGMAPQNRVPELLARAGESENAPFAETIQAANQKHAEDIAVLRDAGEEPTGNPDVDGARAFELHNDPARQPVPASAEPVSDRLNTQLQDALMEAKRRNGGADTQAAFQRAEADAAARRERELDAIQNISRGEEQAQAAARGEVPPNTEPLARPAQEFNALMRKNVPEDAKNAPPRLAQEVAKATAGKKTYQEQLDALTALRDGKKENTTSFEILSKMVDELVPRAPEQPVMQADAVPEAVPQPVVETPTIPPAEVSARGRAQAAADRLDATVAELNAQSRAGNLPANAAARLDEAQALRGSLARAIESKSSSDDYLADLASFADNTATQEAYDAQGPRLAREVESPEAVHPVLDQLMRGTQNVNDVLGFLKDNGSAPWVKELAGKLADFGLDTKITVSNDARGFDPGTVGAYNPRLREARFFEGGASEHTTLHEIMHAAMYDQMDQASRIYAPQNQAEATKLAAFRGLDDIRKEALKRATAQEHYGLTDVHEFVAELNTNPDFQKFLADKGLWQKVVDAVRRLMGMEPGSRSLLEKAMSLQGEFFGKEQYQAAQAARQAVRRFDAAPKDAAQVTDTVLANIARAADEEKPPVNITAITRKAYEKLLPWQTINYIADRVRSVPEMVRSGFSGALDSYERAYKARNLANEYAEETPVKFGTALEHQLHKMKPDDARALNRAMSEIGTGSSIGGFDPTKNFEENFKTRPGLSESNRGYVNEIYRKFKQLERSNPAAAKAIVDGAKVNRKSYVLDQATIMSNLMRAAGDNARRLEADIRLMAPEDAGRARAEARLAGLTKEAQFAIDHAVGLDFMAKDVREAQNTRKDVHIDGAADVMDKRVRAAFEAVKQLPEDSTLRQQLAEMEPAYTNQIENPYYHAGRNGDYFVKFAYRNMDQTTWDRMQDALSKTNKVLGNFNGQGHAFMRFDSLEEARAAYNKMIAAAGDKFVAPESASGRLAEGGIISTNAGVSAAMRSALATLHDNVDIAGLSGDQAAAVKDALTRKFLSMLPETSTRLAQVKRMGVPGFDGDFLGSFAKRAAGGVRDTANIYAMRGFADAFKGMDQAVDSMARTGDPEMQTRAQMASDEIKKRYHNSMQPVENDAVNMLNSLGHSFYLAASPAYLIRSMAQPWHRAIPVIGSRYGFVASAKEMAGATSAAMRIMTNTIRDGWNQDGVRGLLDADLNLDGIDMTPADKAFVKEMHERGVLKLGQARQLQNLVVGGNPRLRDASRMAAMTIQYSDMVNRLVTGLAAFRLAQKSGRASVEANTEYALKAVDNAMDNFDPSNTARAIGKHGFAGKVTPLFTAFMNYNFQTMQQIARTVHDGMFNRDTSEAGKQRSAEAKRELAGLMGTTAMISGALGLPFVSAFAGVYNLLAQDEDNPGDIRQDVRNFLADTTGTDIGNILSHGVGYGLGIDTASFGLQDLLPGSQFLADRRLFKDKIGDSAKGWWGPSINAGLDIAEGLIKLSDGQYVKGVEQMLPSGLKGAMKAYEIANYGYTDSKGNPIAVDASPWDVAIQATGLRPATRALTAEASQYFNVSQSRLDARRALILDELYKGVVRKDPGLVQTATQKIKAFNRANPLQPITDVNSVLRQRLMGVAVGAASGTGVSGAKRELPVLQQDIRFVNNAFPQL